MAVQDDALQEWEGMQGGPANEFVRQQERPQAHSYSPHQLLTGGGLPPAGEYSDPTPTFPAPDVEQVPGQSDAHAGTYTLGRDDA